jgi:signal transduction histidine kinase
MNEFGPRLGLSFVQSIIDSYGGSVSVKDRVEGEHMKGSIFVLRIPVLAKGESNDDGTN